MTYRHLVVDRSGPTIRVTMNNPERRNALGVEQLSELRDALEAAERSDAIGLILGGSGPAFSAGHDMAEMLGADVVAMRRLLELCATVMLGIHRMPQVVIAEVAGVATAAGCQLVAAADLAVAAQSATFAVPGGKGGWFCTTPMVEVGRSVGRKRALELALCGDPIDAATALEWGLVNKVVPDELLATATAELLQRATRGSPSSRALGKPALHHQLGLPIEEAYRYATEVMLSASQIPDAREGMAAFVEKRRPEWGHAADPGPGPGQGRSGSS